MIAATQASSPSQSRSTSSSTRVLEVAVDEARPVDARAPRPSARRGSRGRRSRGAAARAPGSRAPPRPRAPPPRRRRRATPARAARARRAAPRTARGPRRGRSPPAGRRAAARPCAASPGASRSGVWPPNETTTPSGRSSSHDVERALERERLEVEPVGGVVVGRDRRRVRVDHHRLVAEPPERLRGADAAVVELDPLADPVRARAERRRSRGRTARAGRPRARTRGRSTASAPRTRRRRSRRRAGPGAGRRARTSASSIPSTRATCASGSPKRFAAATSPVARQLAPRRPRSTRSSSAKYGWIPGRSSPCRAASSSASQRSATGSPRSERSSSRGASSRPSSAFRNASGNVRPSPSASPTARISVPSSARRARELREVEARRLHRDVVERGLERGRRLAGDVVRQLVERVADGEQRGELRDREPGRLRGERRRARDARVHLDHAQLAASPGS